MLPILRGIRARKCQAEDESVNGGRRWIRTSGLLHVKHFRLSAVLARWRARANRRSYTVTPVNRAATAASVETLCPEGTLAPPLMQSLAIERLLRGHPTIPLPASPDKALFHRVGAAPAFGPRVAPHSSRGAPPQQNGVRPTCDQAVNSPRTSTRIRAQNRPNEAD